MDGKTHTHLIVIKKTAPQELPEIFPGHIPTHREPTQPQHMIMLPILENTNKRVPSDQNLSIKINLSKLLDLRPSNDLQQLQY